MRENAQILRSVMNSCFVVLIVLLLTAGTALAETYASGYLRYTVDDGSVTITGYAGDEEEVTIPAILGANPVNTIASGAFANNAEVKRVNLPNTVETVEVGAFSPGQKVVYAEDAGANENSRDGGGTNGGIDEQPGITLPGRYLLAVDDEGNLVLISPDWTERVLDSSGSWSRTTLEDGAVCITGASGQTVEVDDQGIASFTRDDGLVVTVDAEGGSITTSDPEGSWSSEEVLDADASGSGSEDASAQERGEADSAQEPAHDGIVSAPSWVLPALALLAAAVVGCVIYRRRKA